MDTTQTASERISPYRESSESRRGAYGLRHAGLAKIVRVAQAATNRRYGGNSSFPKAGFKAAWNRCVPAKTYHLQRRIVSDQVTLCFGITLEKY